MRHVLEARAELVLRAGVGAGAEVAARARLDAVAADLHVPEERLAEGDRHRRILDELARFAGPGTAIARRSPGRLESLATGGLRTRGMVPSPVSVRQDIPADPIKSPKTNIVMTTAETSRLLFIIFDSSLYSPRCLVHPE